MSERSDELEAADGLQEQARGHGLAVVRDALRAEHHPDFNGHDCVACGDPLPDVRIADKRVRCAPCATALEKRQKLGRR